MWHELGVALCLVLVIEGIIPFLYPRRWKQLVEQIADLEESTVRWIGFGSMLAGTALLYLVKSIAG